MKVVITIEDRDDGDSVNVSTDFGDDYDPKGQATPAIGTWHLMMNALADKLKSSGEDDDRS